MFACPDCNEGLVRAPIEGGVYWRCEVCGGRAIGVGLLQRLAPSDQIKAAWFATRSRSVETRHACPLCGKVMEEVSLPSELNDVKPGVCRTCRLVWFEAGEFERLPLAPVPSDSDDDLPPQARELFAREEAERAAREAARLTPPDELRDILPALAMAPVEDGAGLLDRDAWLTWLLVTIVAAASLAAFSKLGLAAGRYGFIPIELWRLGGTTSLASLCLHGSILHLAVNVYFLLIFGAVVEERIGGWAYIMLIPFAGIVGNLLQAAFDPISRSALIGASAAVSAVITVHAMQSRGREMRVWHPIFTRSRWVYLPAWSAAVVWTLLQMAGARFHLFGIGGSSLLSHLGGVAVGLLFWLMFKGADEPGQTWYGDTP